jgi:hypothetical protein
MRKNVVQPAANVSTEMMGSPILLPSEVLWFIFMQVREEPCL